MKKKEQSRIIAGGYLRLSDDDAQDGTSVSIETQSKIVKDYCLKHGFLLYDTYPDDGYTGTNFNRPNFKRLMEDAESGKINTIIVKDLSRFGRNYVQVGMYISEILPEMGIRFIAIGDNVDTGEDNVDYDLMVPIKNVFNEYYPADCSRKVRQAFITKASNGEFIGSQAPYGYRKSSEDKHVLEIDEETGPIVIDIFRMIAYLGYGYNKVARVLRERKIIKPAAYQAKIAHREFKGDSYDWNEATILKIVNNETYLGKLISGKRRKLSFKSKRVINQPEDKWIVIENVHPALISQELWDDAHKALSSRKRENHSGFDNIFAGLLKCDKCGYALSIATPGYEKGFYMCNTYRKKGPSRCSKHYIKYSEIYEAVLKDIQEVTSIIYNNEETFVKMVIDKVGESAILEQKRIAKEISDLEQRIADLDVRFERMYDDRLNGMLSDSRFKDMSAKCEEEQARARDKIDELREWLASHKADEENARLLVSKVKELSVIKELDREILNRLVDSIIIGDRIKTSEGVKQSIRINYKFLGELGEEFAVS